MESKWERLFNLRNKMEVLLTGGEATPLHRPPLRTILAEDIQRQITVVRQFREEVERSIKSDILQFLNLHSFYFKRVDASAVSRLRQLCADPTSPLSDVLQVWGELNSSLSFFRIDLDETRGQYEIIVKELSETDFSKYTGIQAFKRAWEMLSLALKDGRTPPNPETIDAWETAKTVVKQDVLKASQENPDDPRFRRILESFLEPLMVHILRTSTLSGSPQTAPSSDAVSSLVDLDVDTCKKNIAFCRDEAQKIEKLMMDLEGIRKKLFEREQIPYDETSWPSSWIRRLTEAKARQIIALFDSTRSTLTQFKQAFEGVALSIEDLDDEPTNQMANVCQQLATQIKAWKKGERGLADNVVILKEDIQQFVRVYVRVKPYSEGKTKMTYLRGEQDSPDSEMPTMLRLGYPDAQIPRECAGDENKIFGPFSRIFVDTYQNHDVYSGVPGVTDYGAMLGHNGFHDLFEKVATGRSLVVFAYGLSGSGKTFSTMGKGSSAGGGGWIDGVLQLGLNYLVSTGQKIFLKSVFELYRSNLSTINPPTLIDVKGRIIQSFGNILGDVSQKTELPLDQTTIPLAGFDNKELNVADVNNLLNAVKTGRKNTGREKATVNNPESSRSHLFIVFEVRAGNRTSYLTFVDMAGQETPRDIMRFYLKGMGLQTFYQSFAKSSNIKATQYTDPNLQAQAPGPYIATLCNEGFYINESVNHLLFYLRERIGTQKAVEMQRRANDVEPYSPTACYVRPDTSADPKNDNVKMLTALKAIDSLSRGTTKWVMFAHVRQEPSKCEDTIKTLRISSEVKST